VQQLSSERFKKQGCELEWEKMYKERSSALAAEGRGEGSLYRDGNKKRLEDGVEKPSPSTSKGGIGKDKDRLAPAAAAAATAQTRRHPGPALEKAKYPDDGEHFCDAV
jgi:hypothetical protein